MKLRRYVAVVAALGLVAAACGGDDDTVDDDPVTEDDGPDVDDDPDDAADDDPDDAADDDPDDAADDAADDDPDDAAAPEPAADADQYDRDAVLRYGYYINLSTMDPHLASGSQDNPWLYPAYDRLVHNTPDAEAIPGLALSWEFVDDGLALEMHLREGVVFHDGEPFNADAVQANIERAKTIEGSAVASTLANVEDVEVVDEHTVRFVLAEPDASLPLVLSDRAGVIISPAAFDNPDLDTIPVGAGAFRVVEHQIDDRVVYERFDDYWDVDNTHLAGIEMILFSDAQTRANALLSGQVDAAELETAQMDQAAGAGFEITMEPDVSFGLVQFNSALRPEFADERVIRAINHAIDREAITEGIFFGFAQPSVQPMPDGYFAHNPEYGPDYFEYDPDLARELLAEAGYADGFAFEMLTTTVPARVQTSEAIQAMLGDVGLDVTVRPIAGVGPFLDAIYGQAEAEAWMLAWGGRPDPSLTLGLLYRDGQFNNPSGRTTDRVEELYQQSITTFDPDERAAVLQELTGEIVESMLDVIVLYFPDKVLAADAKVDNIHLWTAGRPELRGVAILSD